MLKGFLTGLFAVLLVIMPGRTGQAADSAYDQAFLTIHQFYAARDYKPVWTDEDRFISRAKKLPDILVRASTHGLDPETYGVKRMQAVLTDEKPEGAKAWHQAEIFWTYGLWRYASDLLGQPLDAATLESVVDGDIDENLAALAPEVPLYKVMQDRLGILDAQERAAAEAAAAGVPLPGPDLITFKRTLFKPGMTSPAVPLLRARMQEYGALPPEVAIQPATGTQGDATTPVMTPASASPAGVPVDPTVYDENLVKAVQRFQQEHGLKSDGAIGEVTLALLNRSPDTERRQIVANLQRLREPHRRIREARRIEVSIARYWLTAFDGGMEVLAMPVVVGQPRRQTISFRTEISGVRLNPTWTVPNTIKREDYIPLLSKDPAKLMQKHGLRIVHKGKSIDPTLVDWSQVSPREMSQLSMWRPAGAGNPLGQYRVIMENPYDIYLHDTNHPELFAGSMRAQSSGCVRVARPDDLANFILTGKAGWNPQKTKEIVGKGHTHDVIIENKIPIYLDYVTAWLNDRGHLVLGHDVYALDKPRYDTLVNNVLTTQRNAQKLLDQAASILQPELKEARQETVLTQTSN